MIKDYKQLTNEENLELILDGTSFAHYMAKKDIELYYQYKANKLSEISISEERDIRIISLLEQLGYPMDQLGTYLYKEIIAEIYEQIKYINTRRDMEKAKELIDELNNPYSSFYLNIARDYLEIGLKTFHTYISEAISKIDTDNINKELNYGLEALKYAAYISNKYEQQIDIEKPQILGLSPTNK